MKKYIYLALTIVLICHGIYGFENLMNSKDSHSSFSWPIVMVELFFGVRFFYIFKKSSQIKPTVNIVKSGPLNLFGLIFGSLCLIYSFIILRLNFIYHKDTLVVGLFLLIFAIALLAFTYFQYKNKIKL